VTQEIDMLIRDLKELIADLPDDAIITATGDSCQMVAWKGIFKLGTGTVGIHGDFVIDAKDADEHSVFVHGLDVSTGYDH